MSRLEHYSLKTLHLGRMTGVSLGVHAIPDAFLLMHTGVGCKYKAASQIANHDWQKHPNRREGWTEVGDQALIKGSAGRIGPYARTWHERRRPAFIALVTATFLEMTGEDFRSAAARAAEFLDCPLAMIPAEGFSGDLYEGYARLMLEVARRADWKGAGARGDEVGVLGYFFDRYEPDHLGNLQQLRFLLDGLGLKLGPVLLSGRPFGELMPIGRAGLLLQLPHARPVQTELERVFRRRPLPTDLPMGLAGTSRWLREVAAAAGVVTSRVDGFIQAQLRHARPQLAKVADRMRGTGVAVFAETPLAAGLCSLMTEMGLRPLLVGLRGASLGGRQAFCEVLERDGIGLPDGVEILERPSLRRARQRLFELLRTRELRGVIGSSIELNLLATFSPEEWMEVFSGIPVPGRQAGLFALEIGFPSVSYHVTRSEPFLGFGGAVALAQRIINSWHM